MDQQFYTIKELAEMLNVSELWISRRVKTGEIPSYKLGGKRMFRMEEIEQWLESRKEKILSSDCSKKCGE